MPPCLTVQQPWASTLFAGRPVESRSRRDGRCPYPQIKAGQRLLIHAGATMHPWAEEAYRLLPDLPRDLPMSAILGSIHVLGWLTAADAAAIPELAPWVFPDDPDRWYLRHDPERAVRFGSPIPCPGAQGVWDVEKRLAKLAA